VNLVDSRMRHVRKVVRTEYYYGSETDSDSDSESESERKERVARVVIPDESDEEWVDELSDEEEDDDKSDATTVILDDEDWELEEEEEEEEDSEYEPESESESESNPDETRDPKPYRGEGFRVYFDTHADRKLFMRAFGFSEQ